MSPSRKRSAANYVTANGWTVAEVFTDNDIGASRYSGKDRPAWRKIREILQTGDVLVTWAASRAQRDLNAYMELRGPLRRARSAVVVQRPHVRPQPR
ncbi:hypothetical protein F8M49_22210 [Rhodococcus zopfii]|uniref:Resolvase/invertase-type recombinase catalytic domain-containing protein n=1 Tax=Rhodococcus zopfii TaxID=43772 RepID=A0ABU3WTU9_9NOCA|nr:hypothetical protein [Rhodococcus zopfii]